MSRACCFAGLVCAALAGCGSEPSAKVTVRVDSDSTSLLDSLDSAEVYVFDGFLDCRGRLLSSDPAEFSGDLDVLGEIVIDLPAGAHTFHGVGYMFGMPIAVGCQGAYLDERDERVVTISLRDYDGEPLDGGPPIDAPPPPPPDAAPPPVDAATTD